MSVDILRSAIRRAKFTPFPAPVTAAQAQINRLQDQVRELERRLADSAAENKRLDEASRKAAEEMVRLGNLAEMVKILAQGPAVVRQIGRTLRIQRTVAEYYGLTVNDLLSSRCHAATVWARHVAMYLAKEETTHSLTEIARRFRKKDHSCVWHAISRVQRAVAESGKRAAEIAEIRGKL